MDSRPDTPGLADELLAHARSLERLARHLVREDDAARDLVQDTYAAALARPPARIAELGPWLRRTLANRARDRARRGPRRAAREAAAARAEAQPGADAVAARLEIERRLVDAVASLDEPYREAVVLRYLEGVSPAEIARRQGVPAGTARWRVSEGLARLRSELKRDLGEDGRAALVALAGLPPQAAPPITVLTGALVMKFGIAAVATVAAALALYLAWPDGDAPHSALVAVAPDGGGAPADAFRAPSSAPTSGEGGAGTIAPRVVATESSESRAEATLATLLSLAVVDELDRPVVGAIVEVDLDGVETLETGATGRLETFLAALDEGVVVRAVVGASGRARRTIEAPVERGALAFGVVSLTPATEIAGRVVDGNGAPLAGVSVTAYDGPSVLLAERVAHARSDTEGRFALDGVPSGFALVSAGSPLSAPDSAQVVLTVEPGVPVADVELVLPRSGPPGRVAGVVLGPDGLAAPDAAVRAHLRTGIGSHGVSVEVDEEGRFAVEWEDLVEVDLAAHLPRDPSLRAEVADIVPGASEVVLRLVPTILVELEVRSADGRALADIEGSLLFDDDTRAPLELAARAPLRLVPPERPFRVEVRAPEHLLATSARVDPGALPARLTVECAPWPRLAGHVTLGGAPVVGARVTLHTSVRAGWSAEVDGVPLAYEPAGEAVETDADGRFALPVPPAPVAPAPSGVAGALAGLLGRPAARASRALCVDVDADEGGVAVVEGVPEPDAGVSPLEVALTQPGAIEGRLLLPDHAPSGGHWILAGRGVGDARAARTAPDGSFLIEGLAPGPWRVIDAGPEGAPRGYRSSSTFGGDAPWTGDCDVRAGETTRHDVDLRGRTRILGRLTVDDAGPGPWSVLALRPGRGLAGFAGLTSLEPDGSFALELTAPGPLELSFSGALDGEPVELLAPAEVLAGRNDWALALATAPLVVEPGGDRDDLALRIELAGGARWQVALDEDRERRLRVPPGTARLLRLDPDDPLGEPRVVLAARELDALGGRWVPPR